MTSRRSCNAWCALSRMIPAALAISSAGAVGAKLQRARMHAQQRDAMGEDVVHLPGDPGAFELPGLLDEEPLLRLDPASALSQRLDQLAASTDEHPPRQHGREQRHQEASINSNGASGSGRRNEEQEQATTCTAATAATTRRGRWTATVNRAISTAPLAMSEKVAGAANASATPTGHRRRHQNARQAIEPTRNRRQSTLRRRSDASPTTTARRASRGRRAWLHQPVASWPVAMTEVTVLVGRQHGR